MQIALCGSVFSYSVKLCVINVLSKKLLAFATEHLFIVALSLTLTFIFARRSVRLKD